MIKITQILIQFFAQKSKKIYIFVETFSIFYPLKPVQNIFCDIFLNI